MHLPEGSISPKASVYVSHTWSFSFKGLLGALEDFVANNPLPNNEKHYFWLDFCACSPWQFEDSNGNYENDNKATLVPEVTADPNVIDHIVLNVIAAVPVFEPRAITPN
jgi:hypothetical protein